MTFSHGAEFLETLRTIFIAIFVAAGAGSAVDAKPVGFDHSSFDRLLHANVSAGKVNYSAFKNNPTFAAYLSALETANLSGASNDEKLAFWINAYNASVIKNVNDHPGTRKPTDVKGFFDAIKFKVAGKRLTLNDIENTEIRAHFKEPLIHFGLVCAAVNCPPLIDHAYSSTNVRTQLAANARAYLASRYNRYDAAKKTLSLSKIFDWYGDDFGGAEERLRFVASYGTPAMKQAITAGNVKVAFLEYDWTLNGR